MKKHIWFFVGLIVVVIAIALLVTFVQVGLPWSTSRGVSNGFGVNSGSARSSVSSLKMAASDSAISAPMSISSPTPAGGAPTASIPRKITKTGQLSLLVDKAETAVQNIQAIAESATGYVSDSNLYEVTPGVKAGSITIRVPADKFDETMGKIKELAFKVENESSNANDVTDQFIDLEARLKNLKAEETQYLDILKKAQKIDDIINVTNHINDVRSQIDSWQGQLKYLNSQVDLSTITVNLTAEKEAQIFGINWRPLTIINQALHSLLTGLVGYANVIISVIIFLPVIALWVVTILLVLWILWRIVKRLRRSSSVGEVKKKTKKPTA
ncbi:MAG: DUF4349 domain-containing protein [Candidatus Paceibacterota bacterium]|jgi:uncharacterized membrane protein